MTLNKKIFITQITLFVMFITVIFLLFIYIDQSKRQIETIYSKNLKPSQHINEISSLVKDIPFRMSAVVARILNGPSAWLKMNENRGKVNKLWVKFKSAYQSSEISGELQKSLLRFEKSLRTLDTFTNNMEKIYLSQDNDALEDILEDDWPDIQGVVYSAIDNLTATLQEQSRLAYLENIDSNKKFKVFSIIIVFVIIAFMIASNLYMNKLLKQLSTFLNSFFKNISNNVNDLNSDNKKLVIRSDQQAGSLKEMVDSIDVITTKMKNTGDDVFKGNVVVDKATGFTKTAVSKSQHMTTAMSEISSSSKKIGDIVGLVKDIAFQTNILAINASIEAAKSGEFGRGFGVISIEVRELSQKVSKAVTSINELVAISAKKIDGGFELFSDNMETLNDVSTEMQKVTDFMKKTMSVTREQMESMDGINRTIGSIESFTSKNREFTSKLSLIVSFR